MVSRSLEGTTLGAPVRVSRTESKIGVGACGKSGPVPSSVVPRGMPGARGGSAVTSSTAMGRMGWGSVCSGIGVRDQEKG